MSTSGGADCGAALFYQQREQAVAKREESIRAVEKELEQLRLKQNSWRGVVKFVLVSLAAWAHVILLFTCMVKLWPWFGQLMLRFSLISGFIGYLLTYPPAKYFCDWRPRWRLERRRRRMLAEQSPEERRRVLENRRRQVEREIEERQGELDSVKQELKLLEPAKKNTPYRD